LIYFGNKSQFSRFFCQGGAEYDGKGVAYWENIESTAKAKKVGIWSGDVKSESPAEYKKRMKAEK